MYRFFFIEVFHIIYSQLDQNKMNFENILRTWSERKLFKRLQFWISEEFTFWIHEMLSKHFDKGTHVLTVTAILKFTLQ